MISKYKNKKAVFLTIALVLFSLILFSLSSLFVKQKQSENFFVQGSIDRIVNLDASIQNSITRLFSEHSGINITINSNKIKLTETLPPNFATFNSKLSTFETFLENEFSIATLNPDVQNMPLNLTPKGIFYNHDVSLETTTVQRVDLASSIEIKFTFPQGEEGVCPIDWEVSPLGSLRVKISAEDVVTNCEIEKNIDPSAPGLATITHANGNIIVTIDNNEIEISRATNNAYIAETTIEVPSTEEIVSVKMPEILTNVGLENFNIIGEARFLT